MNTGRSVRRLYSEWGEVKSFQSYLFMLSHQTDQPWSGSGSCIRFERAVFMLSVPVPLTLATIANTRKVQQQARDLISNLESHTHTGIKSIGRQNPKPDLCWLLPCGVDWASMGCAAVHFNSPPTTSTVTELRIGWMYWSGLVLSSTALIRATTATVFFTAYATADVIPTVSVSPQRQEEWMNDLILLRQIVESV